MDKALLVRASHAAAASAIGGVTFEYSISLSNALPVLDLCLCLCDLVLAKQPHHAAPSSVRRQVQPFGWK